MAPDTFAAYEATKMHDVTYVHPVGGVIFLACCVISASVQRKKAIIPFLLALLIIPMNQVVAIFTLDFTFTRILVVVLLARLFLRSELYPEYRNRLDKTLILYVLVISLVYIAQWHNVKSIVYRVGLALDVVGSYVVFRSLVRDYDDFENAIKAMVFASLVLAIGVSIEQALKTNTFHYIGPVPENVIYRDGRIRSVGSFNHFIYMGTYGALTFPLFASFLTHRKKLALLGMVSSSVIVYCSSSSGPVLGYLAGIGALMLYPFRRYLRVIRWLALATVVILQLVMTGPVWSLLNKAAVFTASTAYHRYYLVDQFIRRWNEWFLLGTRSTEHWSEYLSMWDITNQYVAVGVDGGIISLALFICVLVLCFKSIGSAMNNNDGDGQRRFAAWCVGASLFSDSISFIGLTYWGQIMLLFVLSVAIASMFRDLSMPSGVDI